MYKRQLKDEVWEFFKSQTTNITDDDIIGRWGLTPLEYETWNPAMKEGDLGMIGLQPSQMYDMRPFPGKGHTCLLYTSNIAILGRNTSNREAQTPACPLS